MTTDAKAKRAKETYREQVHKHICMDCHFRRAYGDWCRLLKSRVDTLCGTYKAWEQA